MADRRKDHKGRTLKVGKIAQILFYIEKRLLCGW